MICRSRRAAAAHSCYMLGKDEPDPQLSSPDAPYRTTIPLPPPCVFHLCSSCERGAGLGQRSGFVGFPVLSAENWFFSLDFHKGKVQVGAASAPKSALCLPLPVLRLFAAHWGLSALVTSDQITPVQLFRLRGFPLPTASTWRYIWWVVVGFGFFCCCCF